MKYFLRAVKYLFRLTVLLAIIFWLMRLSGTSNLGSGAGFADMLVALWASARGKMMVAAIVVWSAVYPAVEYRRRGANWNLTTHRDAIVKAFDAGRMRLTEESEGRMVFVGTGLRRVIWLGEDAVTVTPNAGGGIDFEGPRRFVTEALTRIPYYVAEGE